MSIRHRTNPKYQQRVHCKGENGDSRIGSNTSNTSTTHRDTRKAISTILRVSGGSDLPGAKEEKKSRDADAVRQYMSLKLKAEEETILTSPFVPYSVKVYYVNHKSMTSHKILTHCVEATVESNIMMSIVAYIFELIAGRLNEYHPQVSAIINRAANFLKTYSGTPRYFQYVLKNSQDPTTGGVRHNFIDDCPLLVAMVYDFCTDYCDAFSSFFLPNNITDMDNDIKRLIEINASMPCILGDELLTTSTPPSSSSSSLLLPSNHSNDELRPKTSRQDDISSNNSDSDEDTDTDSYGDNNSIDNSSSSEASSSEFEHEDNSHCSGDNTKKQHGDDNNIENLESSDDGSENQLSNRASNSASSIDNSNNVTNSNITPESIAGDNIISHNFNDSGINKQKIQSVYVDVHSIETPTQHQLQCDNMTTLCNDDIMQSPSPIIIDDILPTNISSLQSSDDICTINIDNDNIDANNTIVTSQLFHRNSISSNNDNDEETDSITELNCLPTTGLSIGVNKQDKYTSTYDILQSGKY
ncbi:hypothetical protein DOLIC_00085 [Dolichomitus sp. PSUC_FEM 10030005]|nr:hypothetical protein [Dolichomitus sp. PSUC_FEM 10030005]